MSNIAEGFEREGKKELIQFLSIAKGSAGEVRSLLQVAYREKYINKTQFSKLYGKTEELSKMLHGFMKYLNNSTKRGIKYRF